MKQLIEILELAPSALVLLSGHGLGARDLDLLGLLDQSTEWTTADEQQVIEGGAGYTPLLPDLAANLEGGDDVGDGQDVGQAAGEAGLADRLSILAELVAGHEVADDAQADVVEAAEETVLPFSRHDDRLVVGLSEGGGRWCRG